MATNEAAKKMGPMDVVTPEFRASYPNLFEARAADPLKPNDKNFGVEMIFRVAANPKAPIGEKIVTIDALKAAVIACATEAWGADQKSWPAKWKHPFKKPEGEKLTKDGYDEGVIYVRAGRKESFGRPVVVAQDPNQDVIDKNLVYGGMYCRAKIHAYAWSHPTGGKGVSFNLDMVQLVRDGEPFGNKIAATDAFEAIPMPVMAGSAGKAPAGAAAGAQPAAAAGVFGDLG